MNVVLDTSAYSAVMKGYQGIDEVLSVSTTIFMSAIVIGELKYGFLKGSKILENEARLKVFLGKSQVSTYELNEEVAGLYARLKLTQQKSGLNLATNDLWIAATALYLDATLVTYDGDFGRIDHPGFRLTLLSR